MTPRAAVLDEVEFQAVRRKGIGGSDVPAILGLSPFRTASDVFAQKLGLGPAFEETEPMRWGKLIEPLIAQEYARREGVRVQWPTPNNPQSRFLTHPAETWRRATIDYVLAGGARVGVDAKMASVFTRDKWGVAGTDQVPDDYLCQMLWYLDVTEFERWDVAVLLGSELRTYRILPHPELQAHLREVCGRFWHDNVLAKVPPATVDADDTRRQLEALYPRDRQPIRVATPGEERAAQLYARALAQGKRAEAITDALKQRLCEAIGDAGGLEGPMGRITWKRSADSNPVDWEAVAGVFGDRLPEEYKKAVRAHTKQRNGSRRFLAKLDALACPIPENDTIEALELDVEAIIQEAVHVHHG